MTPARLFAVATFLGIALASVVPATASAPIPSGAPGPEVQSACGTWQVVPTPNPSSQRNLLRAVSAASATDAWAVGGYDVDPDPNATNIRTLTLHRDGVEWTVVPSPNVGVGWNMLQGVDATPRGTWAVGWWAPTPSGGKPQTLAMCWDGREWLVESSPSVQGGSELLAVDATPSGDVWAVGDQAVGAPGPTTGTLVLRRSGGSWSIVPSPNVANRRNNLWAVEAIASDDVWAVGYSRNVGETFKTLTMHWDGVEWTVVPSPNLGYEAFLYSVRAAAADDVWAVGEWNNGTTYLPLALHWNGSAWSIANSSAGGAGAVAVIGPDDVWTVGREFAHWDGATWEVQGGVPDGGTLLGAAAVGPCDAWAAGRAFDATRAFVTLVMRLLPGQDTLARPGPREVPVPPDVPSVVQAVGPRPSGDEDRAAFAARGPNLAASDPPGPRLPRVRTLAASSP